jgi:hypothetical protein
MKPGTRLVYHGATAGALMYGDYVTVVESLPHGTHFVPSPWQTFPAEPFLPNKNRVIGQWLLVREDSSDSLALAPTSHFHIR